MVRIAVQQKNAQSWNENGICLNIS